LGSAPDPAGRAHSAPPDPLLLRVGGRGGKRGRGKKEEREGKEGRGWERKGGGGCVMALGGWTPLR